MTELTPVAGSTSKATAENSQSGRSDAAFLYPYERELIRYVVKYGMCYLCDVAVDDSGETRPMNVLEYVSQELRLDEINLTDPMMAAALDMSCRLALEWPEALENEKMRLEERRNADMAAGIDEIWESAEDIASIETREKELTARVNARYATAKEDFAEMFLQHNLLSCDNDNVRRITTDMVSSRHSLSKIHTKYTHIATERDRLAELVPLAVYNLKCALIECEIRNINSRIAQIYKSTPDNLEQITELLTRNRELNNLKKELSVYLGERILSPHGRH